MSSPNNLLKTLTAPLSWKLAVKTVIGFILVVSLIIFWADFLATGSDMAEEEYWDEEFADETEEADCNVAGIILRGDILTYTPACDAEAGACPDVTASEEVIYHLDKAGHDENIKAVLFEVDSTGGEPVAAEEIVQAVSRLEKPVAAMVRAYGDSAAYWITSAADVIFAQKTSDVGGIGVSLSYLDNSEKNKKEGITFVDLSSGLFKNAGNPDKPLTAEEREYLLRDTKIMHEQFIQAVAENRKLEIEKVRALADGSSMLGETAIKMGLIDRIGGIYEVKDWLKEQIGVEADICWN